MKTFCVIICLLMLALIQQIVYAQQPLAQQAFAIFEQHCLDCHGEFGSYSDVLTIKHKDLIENRSVIPGQPDASELYLRLLGDTDSGSQMPLGQEPLEPEAIATIRRWIEVGAPDWEAIPKPKRSFITTEVMLKTIHTHVTSLTAFDRSFARYFALTHLYNAGASDDNLRAYRNALSKLVNSLSWGSEVIKPKPIDREETIFYIDLRHYEWDIKSDKWYKIEQAYPYGVQLKSPTYTTLCQETDCELPFIRADWFIATASLPPLYHEILDLPKTDRELETQLEVNVAENLKNAPGVRVWRAGFNNSGVSVNNRIVERHKSRYGAYWKSYDFAGNVGTQNIFTHPLGFTHDGGEIIFNLPNGLQAYYLSTAKGERLDEAPINIVSNAGARDPVVRNGLSCMGCHTEGMKTFDDQVRLVIAKIRNPSYDKAQVSRLYVEKSRMDSLVREDITRYRWAIEDAGGVFGGSEPIQQLVKQFEGPLDAAHAAAEVGLQTADFLQKIRETNSLQKVGLLVLDVPKGSVKRDFWESQFGIVNLALNLVKPDSADAYNIQGLAKNSRGDYGAAISDFDAALRLKPDSVEAYIGRGLAKVSSGQYGGAIVDFDAVLRLKPDSAEAYSGRGLAKAALGQYEAAIVDCNAALRLKPDSADAYIGRGLAKAGLGQYEGAIANYNESLRLKPDSDSVYGRRGLAKAVLGQYEGAIADFDAVLRLKPDSADAYYSRGLAKAALEQYEGAVSDYNESIRLKPNFSEAYSARGSVKSMRGEYERAIIDYNEALRLKPNSADYSRRGLAKVSLGQYEEAIEDYNESIRLNPSFFPAYYERGRTRDLQKHYEAAIFDYDAALRLSPNFAQAYHGRGLAKGKLGRISEGKQDLRTALKLAEQTGNQDLKDEIERFLQGLEDKKSSGQLGSHNVNSEVIFQLIESISFADGTEVKSIAKADIEALQDRPIRLGENDHLDGVTLMNEKDEKIHVRTCREYDAALKQGYDAYTTFDIKMSVWFKHQCGLLNALEGATISQKSFISNPKVGIVNLELLPFSLFSDPASTNWQWDAERDVDTTYQKKMEKGDFVIIEKNQNFLRTEEEGMGQWLEEVVRADFNNDGIEDILLFEYHYATQGTLGFGGIIVLTRKSVNGKFEAVRPSNPAQSSAHPYWFD